MTCPRCKGTEFRLSSIRWGDVGQLLLLHHPVRCRNCHHRMYGGLLLSLVLLQLRRVHLGSKPQ